MVAGRLLATHSTTVHPALSGALPLGQLMPGAQGLGHGPCLRDAPPRRERRVAVEDLGDGSEPVIAEVMGQWREEGASRFGIAVRPEVREREWAEEECPHGALMIGAVALLLIAAVVSPVRRIIGREASEPVRGQQVAGTGVDDPALTFGRKWALAERDRVDLVRPDRVVVSVGRVDDVVAAPETFVPEA